MQQQLGSIDALPLPFAEVYCMGKVNSKSRKVSSHYILMVHLSSSVNVYSFIAHHIFHVIAQSMMHYGPMRGLPLVPSQEFMS